MSVRPSVRPSSRTPTSATRLLAAHGQERHKTSQAARQPTRLLASQPVTRFALEPGREVSCVNRGRRPSCHRHCACGSPPPPKRLNNGRGLSLCPTKAAAGGCGAGEATGAARTTGVARTTGAARTGAGIHSIEGTCRSSKYQTDGAAVGIQLFI